MIDDEKHMTFIVECWDRRGNIVTYSIGATNEERAREILEDFKQPDHRFARIREIISNREYSRDKLN